MKNIISCLKAQLKKKKTEEFNLEKILSGCELVTKNGHKAKIISIDFGYFPYPLLVHIETLGNYYYTSNGRFFLESDFDIDLLLVTN